MQALGFFLSLALQFKEQTYAAAPEGGGGTNSIILFHSFTALLPLLPHFKAFHLKGSTK